MAGKHQWKISKSSTRRKAERGWRRRDKQNLARSRPGGPAKKIKPRASTPLRKKKERPLGESLGKLIREALNGRKLKGE